MRRVLKHERQRSTPRTPKTKVLAQDPEIASSHSPTPRPPEGEGVSAVMPASRSETNDAEIRSTANMFRFDIDLTEDDIGG